MKVSVFQWPCGTFATNRSPRGERPYRRTIFVVTDVSSMKTRRRALSFGCSAFKSARAAATSGRSCSAACRLFFECDLVPVVEAPDRTDGDIELLVALQAVADFFERQIGFGRDEIEEPAFMGPERRLAVTGSRRRLDAARRSPPLDPADGRRRADVEWTSPVSVESRLLLPDGGMERLLEGCGAGVAQA